MSAKEVEEFYKSLKKSISQIENKYVKDLESHLQELHIKKLSSLSEEDVKYIVKLKLLWEPYLKYTGNRQEFKENFIRPVDRVKSLILTDVATIEKELIKEQRSFLLELADYKQQCERKLNIDIDPTKKLKTPTNIPYTSLDTPQTYQDYLHLLERTLSLKTASNKEAHDLLMKNVENSKIIDVYEAEFTFFSNQIRMLMGTIGWLADPLLCNCARDHSHDRKDGKASGHSSTIPGKKSFVDRARRMGTSARSEGAGGGKTGVAAIMGLSYGGGHTGPLYSTKRNIVGVGVRLGACTAMYRGDNSIKHPAPAIDNFNFMPPGLGFDHLKKHSSLSSYYKMMQKGEFTKVISGLERFTPRKDADKIYQQWFSSYALNKMKYQINEVIVILKAGDAYMANEKFRQLRKRLSGKLFDGYTKKLSETLRSIEVSNEIRKGKEFHKMISKKSLKDSILERFVKSSGESAYAKAAQTILDNRKSPQKKFHNLSFFLKNYHSLSDYGYPQSLVEEK